MTPPESLPRLASLRLAYVAYFVSLGVYAPFFPRWLEARGVTGVSLGVVSATLPALGVVGPPLFGWAADRLRLRGRLLSLSLLGAGALFALTAPVAAASEGHALWPLFALMLVFALVRSPIVTLLDVLTLEHAEGLGTSFGGVRLFGSLGFLLAAVGAGAVLDPRALWPLPLAVSAAFLACAAVASTLPRVSRAPETPRLSDVRALLARPDYQLACLTILVAQLGHSAYDLTYSLHLRDLGFSDGLVGVAWALGVVAEVGLMALSPRLFEGGKQPVWMVIGLAGAVVRWGLMGSVHGAAAVLALQPLHAFSFAMVWMGGATWVKGAVRPELLATAQGTFLGAYATGSLGGMLLWADLYKTSGGALVFHGAAGVALAAMALCAVFARVAARTRRREAVVP